jgi:hypothetical protein
VHVIRRRAVRIDRGHRDAAPQGSENGTPRLGLTLAPANTVGAGNQGAGLTLIGQGAEGERFAEGRLHVRAMTPKNRRLPRISEARLEEMIEAGDGRRLAEFAVQSIRTWLDPAVVH